MNCNIHIKEERALFGARGFSQDAGNLHKKAPRKNKGLFKSNFGGVLLSHAVTHAVPSALKSLTAVFGMGTGVSSSLLPPKTF